MYHTIIISLSAVILSQLIKTIIDAKKGLFSWNDINSYGGFPSSHASFTVALTFCCGYFSGWDSSVFAVALVFTVLTIRDAMGFRRLLGKQAENINKIISILPDKKISKLPHLKERIGHSGLEILGGAVLGILIPVIYIIIFL